MVYTDLVRGEDDLDTGRTEGLYVSCLKNNQQNQNKLY